MNTKKQSFWAHLKRACPLEALEYALIAGLIVIAGIAVIATIGSKVLASWTQ